MGIKMNSNRRTAIIVGVLFIFATVSAIIGLILYDPILNDSDYLIKGFENKNQVILGALFELILVCSAIGTSIMLFPFLKKYNESIALGYVCFRLLEAVVIGVGIISVLSLLTLSQEFVEAAAPNAASFQTSPDDLRLGPYRSNTHSAFRSVSNVRCNSSTFNMGSRFGDPGSHL
ncbi:MAG: hypothetical protein K0S39_2511 [Paenibacillus sp.]|jgi:hypothetical protein|nr:hypothetical protein [Paenibacillus sp.]